MVKKMVFGFVLAALLFINVGCYGSFSLTKKIYDWNGDVGDKWIQSAVMWVMIVVPVYEACSFIDLVAFNVIEFWTGKNPVVLTLPKVTKKEFASGNKTYRATMGNGELTIQETAGPDAGRKVTLLFDRKNSTVKLVDASKSYTVATVHPHPVNTVDLYYPDGRTETKMISIDAVAMHR